MGLNSFFIFACSYQVEETIFSPFNDKVMFKSIQLLVYT